MTPLSTAGFPDEEAVYRKVTWRIVPFLFVCYIAAYLDRVNVGFAKLQMQADLAFSDTVYGLGAGIFFIGYFFFEVPSNILLHKVGARAWIARIMITWGLISAATMFVQTAFWFYLLRFSLGVAEAGFFPGVILYLTYWYPARRRARIVGLFMMAIAVSGVIGSPLSGWIMQRFAGLNGWAGWQWLFLLEGLPSVVIGLAVLFHLDNSIREARWLSDPEKLMLESNVGREDQLKAHLPLRKVLTHPSLLLLSLIYFCISMGLYGVSFWLPQLVRNASVHDPLQIGMLTALPYACATLSMWLVSRSSDLRGERRWHFALCAFAGGIGLILSTAFGPHVWLALPALALATAGILSAFPIFWTMPTSFLAGTGAAAGIALVNSIGGLAGFVSPYLVGWIRDTTKSLDPGLYVIAGSLFTGAVLVLRFVPAHLAAKAPPHP
ncbi:MAG: proP [Chthoniobacter sp.]|nr:proP [Chthoniobacter sp.]